MTEKEMAQAEMRLDEEAEKNVSEASAGDTGIDTSIWGSEVADDVASADAPEEGMNDDPEGRIQALEEQLSREKENYLRLYADFENYKKRSARDMQEFRKYANENLFRELLPIVDNLERAVESSESGQDDVRCIVEGVDLTLKEMLRLFDKFNLKPIEALGDAFDPSLHEAVGQDVSDEYGRNTVMRVFQKGYKLHDRLIRPAMVIVSAGPATAPEKADDGQPEDRPGDGDGPEKTEAPDSESRIQKDRSGR